MTAITNPPTAIVRAERGLTIAGTRMTLYDVLGHLEAGWTPKLLRHWLPLTAEQIDLALSYIDAHRAEVEAEYQTVLQTAQEIRSYWDDQNRERFARIAALPPKPGQEAVRAKLAAWKARRDLNGWRC